jgi:hypothetical protein
VKEEWRPFFDGAYEVSNLGNVRRASPGRCTWAGRPLKHTMMNTGYPCVRPVKDGKNVLRTVHSLVAEAFLGPANGREVNHKDGNKANPRLDNLEYVTHAGNMAHAGKVGLIVRGERHPGSKFTAEDIRSIRAARAAGSTYTQLSRQWCASTCTLFKIVNRKAWRHV